MDHAGKYFKNLQENILKCTIPYFAGRLGRSSVYVRELFQKQKISEELADYIENRLDIQIPENIIQTNKPQVNTIKRSNEYIEGVLYFDGEMVTESTENEIILKSVKKYVSDRRGLICDLCLVELNSDQMTKSKDKDIMKTCKPACNYKKSRELETKKLNAAIFDVKRIKSLYLQHQEKVKKNMHHQTINSLIKGSNMDDKVYLKFADLVGVKLFDLLADPYRDLVKKSFDLSKKND